MQTHRNYHLRVDPQVSFDDIRNMIETLDDGTYFIRIDPDSPDGPFIELHGDPKESEKIAEKLAQMTKANVRI